jgi:hypothetical protein
VKPVPLRGPEHRRHVGPRARRRRVRRCRLGKALAALLWALAGVPALAAADPEDELLAPDATLPRAEEEQEDDEEGLRQRLTEREDKRRPLEPWHADVAGRPLTVSGEYEAELVPLRRWMLGEGRDPPDRLVLEQDLEVEVFYSFGPPLSLFAQMRGVMAEDLRSLPRHQQELDELFVERGEMWLYSEDIAGSHLDFDIGRLDFEDDRRWWWDEERDAARVAWETERFELVAAVAYELAPERLDQGFVEPEEERLLRWIGEASWDWSEDHAVELFLLHQHDHSRRERVGEELSLAREDESDARLTWLGARAMGAADLGAPGILGYWLDAALVRGDERLVDVEDLSDHRGVVEGVVHRDVSGWGVDAGAAWILPLLLEPRLFAGYAFGSGDPTPEQGSDRSFRQSGLEANEAGFGGVERFESYGVVLGPELSNLGIVTLGVGLSVLRSSSLDLVYHRYRLVEDADFLRDSRLEAELTGRDRAVGDEIDLVLAVEEWERLELEFIAAGFRAGRAFGPDHGRWSWGGLVAARYAF